ncbi:MAG TPA: hypothetical protein VK387_03215 [Thermoleophilaceae bacterium]|nr:hypothetical protein [Thermoleophilaceae bacterium]
MGWTFFFMMVVLKIPILALAWIVWWACRPEARPEGDTSDGGGGTGPRHPRPRPSRRGPHAGARHEAPRRVRAPAGRRGRPARAPRSYGPRDPLR